MARLFGVSLPSSSSFVGSFVCLSGFNLEAPNVKCRLITSKPKIWGAKYLLVADEKRFASRNPIGKQVREMSDIPLSSEFFSLSRWRQMKRCNNDYSIDASTAQSARIQEIRLEIAKLEEPVGLLASLGCLFER